MFNAGAALTGMAPETSVEYLDRHLLLGEPPSRATDILGVEGNPCTAHCPAAGCTGSCRRTGSLLAIRQVQSSAPSMDPSLTAGEADLVLACLAPLGSRPRHRRRRGGPDRRTPRLGRCSIRRAGSNGAGFRRQLSISSCVVWSFHSA